MSEADEPVSKALPGRTCGPCSLCCKLIAITESDKPESRCCAHCSPGEGGCLIYERRPPSCQGFHCGWLQSDNFGPEWKPTTAKMVVAVEGGGNRWTIYVDPSFPSNWQKEPYYSQLRNYAYLLAEHQVQLLVRIHDRVIVLVPGKEIDLGTFEKEDQIITARNNRTGEWSARKILARDVPAGQRGKWVKS